MAKVRIKIANDTASGRRTGWTKHVTAVDETKANGYAFEGEFIDDGQHEIDAGSVLISKDPKGSAKNGYHVGCVGIVRADGAIDWTTPCDDWRKNFLDLRDAVAAALNTEPPNPLESFTDEQIAAEYERRQLAATTAP